MYCDEKCRGVTPTYFRNIECRCWLCYCCSSCGRITTRWGVKNGTGYITYYAIVVVIVVSVVMDIHTFNKRVC